MRKLKDQIKVLLGNTNLLNISKGNRYIFVYHDISNRSSIQHSPHYSTFIDSFKKQIELIYSAFDIVPLNEIVSNERMNPKKNYAAITFDDGFSSILSNAHPILNTYKIPYFVFINGSAVINNQNWLANLEMNTTESSYCDKLLKLSSTNLSEEKDPINAIIRSGYFGKSFRKNYQIKHSTNKLFLNIEDVQYLLTQGVEFGNHSHDHFVLSSTNSEEVDYQISRTQDILQAISTEKINHFAIPFGHKTHYNQSTIDKLRTSGYKYIYTTNPNRFRAQDLEKPDFLFPRICLTNETPEQILFYINRSILKHYNL